MFYGFRPLLFLEFLVSKGTRSWEFRMIANALIVTIALLLALGFWLMGELRFLIPYRHVLLHQHGMALLLWCAMLFINVFAAVYAIQRKFFLKDTGRKLSHLDNQALTGQLPSPLPADAEEPD